MKRKNNIIFWALLTYTIITIVLTYPLVLHLNNALYAQPGDAFGMLYDMWRMTIEKINYFFPGQTLFLGIIRLLRYVFSETIIYNIFILGSFILTGLAGFVLVKKITKNDVISVIGGLIFILCPFRTTQALQHITFADLSLMLFFIYFLLLVREEKKWTYLLILSLLFCAITLINYQYGVFAILIYAIYLLANFFISNKKNKYIFLYSLISIAIGGLIILAINHNFVSDYLSMKNGGRTQYISDRSYSELNVYSAQWFYYFLPSPDNPIFGQYTAKYYDDIVGTLKTNKTEQIIYLGIVNIIFAIVALFNYKKIDKFIFWFAILLIIFGIYFSFAPTMPFLGVDITAPGAILYNIMPFVRVYCRLGLLTYFGIAILSLYGIYFVYEKISKKYLKTIFIVVISILISSDLLVLPKNRITKVDTRSMPMVYSTLESLPTGTIAEYPQLPAEEPLSYEYLLWKRVHQLPTITNYTGSVTENDLRKSILDPSNLETIGQLKTNGVKYIIIHTHKYLTEKAQKYPQEYNFGIVPDLDISALGLDYLGDYNGDLLYRIN